MKCKFYSSCPLAQPCYTCHHQAEAKGYCGKYKELDFQYKWK